ncbi:uncharacterized protein At5g41620-like [Cornus florida]|uniref:uncharacterized protein At5g41620-like n=1 Tax=Cornus florida TaxID=4283 RepID=UPI002898ED14|nr:uncharacterized protein At5g41620-like [Cornus florida]
MRERTTTLTIPSSKRETRERKCRDMKSSEKSGGGPAEKQENLGEKLKLGVLVGKRGGQTTPVAAGGAQDSIIINTNKAHPQPLPQLQPPHTVSARKLAATLWELDHYHLPLSKMHHGVNGPPPRLRRLHHHHHHHHLYKDQGLDLPSTATILPDPPPSSPDVPGSASSLRRHVAASLMQHHRSIERSNHARQPVSPASYGSSMELAPYNPAVTPTSSLDFKGRIGETGYSLKTSTELLKVLNRIWSLEEQHTSNMSLVKALKRELDHARARIKELVRDQQADRHERDELMKQIAEDKVARKSKEHDRISAAIQSVRDELEDERKLRKRSEGLHRKLARELYDVKTSLANALKELERERKSRKLLEDLCDEFAWEIKDYEQEVHALKQKSDKDWADRADRDRLILHISESWLDERMQMKQNGLGEKNSIIDKLSSEIETFLKAKRTSNPTINDNLVTRGPNLRRNSMESIPLNVAVSAPQDVDDEEDSADSDSHCFELNKPSSGDIKSHGDEAEESHIDEMVKPNQTKKKLASRETIKGRNITNLQVKFEEQMARATSRNENVSQVVDKEQRRTGERNPAETSISRKSEICEATEEGDYERKNKSEGTHRLDSQNVIDNLIRSQLLLSESANVHHENEYRVASCGNPEWRRTASPVRQWTARLPSQDLDISESSSKLPVDLKENTLKAKLLEARTRGQRSRSRLKASRVSS